MESSASSRLHARASGDHNVVGIVHSGSCGRRLYVIEQSDWDYSSTCRDEYPSVHVASSYCSSTRDALAIPREVM
jgi:hypothetical protein